MANWNDLPFDVKSLIMWHALRHICRANRRHKNKNTLLYAKHDLTRQLISLAAAVPKMRFEFIRLIRLKIDEATQLCAELSELCRRNEDTDLDPSLFQDHFWRYSCSGASYSQTEEMESCCILISNAYFLRFLYDVTFSRTNMPWYAEQTETEWGVTELDLKSQEFYWLPNKERYWQMPLEREYASFDKDTRDWNAVASWHLDDLASQAFWDFNCPRAGKYVDREVLVEHRLRAQRH